MEVPANEVLIGVDGGGSGSRGVLVAGARRVTVAGGPANATTDPDGAAATLAALLEALRVAAGLPGAALAGARAYLGVAGVIAPALARRLAAALPVCGAVVEDDRRAALVGALGARDGGVIAAGTGAFAGVRRDGTERFAGGWGLELGDEGSGAWLGRGALAATLRAEDGTGPESALTRRLRARHGGRPAGILAWARDAGPSDFATLAPDVVAAARDGDQVGAALMRDGAAHLARALAAAGWAPRLPLCVVGGIGPALAPWLPADLAAAIVAPAGGPLDGALALALSGEPLAPGNGVAGA